MNPEPKLRSCSSPLGSCEESFLIAKIKGILCNLWASGGKL